MISEGPKIRHADFAARMGQACDNSPHVPPLYQGRLTWISDQFRKRFDDQVAPEVIRKWLTGESRPRQKRLSGLSEILGVDEIWLLAGAGDRSDLKQVKSKVVAEGAIKNLVIGAVELEGGRVALPREGDSFAKENAVDFYIFIRGAQYAAHIVQFEDGVAQVPGEALDAFILGVVRDSAFSFRVYELDREGVEEHGRWANGHFEVAFDAKEWREITSFAERL